MLRKFCSFMCRRMGFRIFESLAGGDKHLILLDYSISLTEMSCVMRKPTFCICENKDADQLRGNREADQRLCFRYIVQSLYFLNPKFQASSHLLWLYSLVCVRPGRKPEYWFSHDAAQILFSEEVHVNGGDDSTLF